METLEGFPNLGPYPPPTTPLASLGLAAMVRAELSSAARARAKPEGWVGRGGGPECRRPPHAFA
jgi:hypothetical protein